MEFFNRHSGLIGFCAVAFAAVVGISAVVAATPPGEEVPAAEDGTAVRKGHNAVLVVHSRRRLRPAPSAAGSRSSDRYDRRRRGYSTSSRRDSVGNRSYRGGGLFGGK